MPKLNPKLVTKTGFPSNVTGYVPYKLYIFSCLLYNTVVYCTLQTYVQYTITWLTVLLYCIVLSPSSHHIPSLPAPDAASHILQCDQPPVDGGHYMLLINPHYTLHYCTTDSIRSGYGQRNSIVLNREAVLPNFWLNLGLGTKCPDLLLSPTVGDRWCYYLGSWKSYRNLIYIKMG